jgi:hypothetical protein
LSLKGREFDHVGEFPCRRPLGEAFLGHRIEALAASSEALKSGPSGAIMIAL